MINKFHHNNIYNNCSEAGRLILKSTGFNMAYFDYECYNVIDVLNFDFYEGNCIKYLWRLGRKDSIKNDLEKIKRYTFAVCERKTGHSFFHNLNKNFDTLINTDDFSRLANTTIM